MRKREFDNQEVLKDSVAEFWRRGYYNTSIDDLTTATGVSRSGLYGVFESKRGLFLASMRFYEDHVVDHLVGTLERSNGGKAAICLFFQSLLPQEGRAHLGCLVCNTSSEVSHEDPVIGERVTQFFGRVRAALHRSLTIARAADQLTPDTNVDVMADFLLVAFQSVAHASRSPLPASAIVHYVDGVLSLLESVPFKSRPTGRTGAPRGHDNAQAKKDRRRERADGRRR